MNHQLEDLFHVCVKAPPDEWPALVESLPEEERGWLLKMLASDRALSEKEQTFLVSSQTNDVPATEEFHVNEPTSEEDRLAHGEKIPERIGDYRILNVIAVHGQGVVYRADHPHLNRQVVIKVSKNPLDKAGRQAVLEEGQALAALSHPHLAEVYDLQVRDGCPYLVMEFIEGRNLAEEQLKKPRMRVDEAASLVATLARAIQHAHQVGIVHRDLKPANVVVRAVDRQPKIIDFGLATSRTAYVTEMDETSYGGTIAYMAPELATQMLSRRQSGVIADATDERVDIFALGAILYELLTGKRLYTFESSLAGLQMAAAGDMELTPLEDDSIPRKLRQACVRALAKDPKGRWSSAADLADAVESKVSSSRRKAIFAIVALVGVVLIVFAWWLTDGFRSRSVPDKDKSLVEKKRSVPVKPNDFGGRLLPGLRFTHFANDDDLADASPLFKNDPLREDDDLRIEVRFAQPSYCFLIAVNPDGVIQLCYPEDAPETIQKATLTQLRYPANPTKGFPFTDGVGQQAFILVRSTKPLPSFREWSATVGNLAAIRTNTKGRWLWSRGRLEAWIPEDDTRGRPRQLRGSEGFVEAMKRIESAHPDVTISGITFPVQKR